jgi:hypothetical protein
MWLKFLHWWHGCAKFNRIYPSWRKTGPEDWAFDEPTYPTCKICGHLCWWMWGYKKLPPDINAQKAQGTKITEQDRYYAKTDGWL